MERGDQRITGTSQRTLRVRSVSYLNAKPLIYGLERLAHLQMRLDVPSGLLDDLRFGRCDVALLPVIDYQKDNSLKMVPSGGIGSDGATLTVRIFSPKPIEEIEVLACDVDSHTSTALAQVILAESYGLRPKILDLKGDFRAGDGAILLIGDKVVCEEPPKMPFQLDLGEAWKKLTGLPFVFAIWTARGGVDLGDLPERLEKAKELGMGQIDAIVAQYAVPRGWPAELARHYLTHHLQFDIGPKQLEAIRLFHQLAHQYGLISEPRPLEMY